MKAVLIRQKGLSNSRQTCGRFILIDDKGDTIYQCASLELPWKDNQRNVSCIPEGKYNVSKKDSPKFGKGTFAINDVPGRSNILIHPGNFTREIQGCILLGERFSDIDKDKITDVVRSRATINKVKSLADTFELTIISI